MSNFVCIACTILMFVLTLICIAAEIADTFDPDLHLMDTIGPIILVAVIILMSILFKFFGYVIDFDIVREFFREGIGVWLRACLEFFISLLGCPHP